MTTEQLTEMNAEGQLKVDLEPVGRRATIEKGLSLLDAAQRVGVDIVAVCGGVGACGKCRVRLVEGELSPPTAVETRTLSEGDQAAGFRLACQAYPLTDVKIDIPPESLSTPQRLQSRLNFTLTHSVTTISIYAKIIVIHLTGVSVTISAFHSRPAFFANK